MSDLKERKVGFQYIIPYRDIIPSYQESYKRVKRENGSSGFCYLEELKDDYAVLKYLGDGVYEDLHTGYHIAEDGNLYSHSSDLFPFVIVTNSNEKDKTDEVTIDYDSIQRRKFYMDMAVEEIYQNMLGNDSLGIQMRNSVQRKLLELKQKKIGAKYAVSYQYLNPVLSDGSRYNLFNSNYTWRGKHTIIEYLGNGLYKDLSTDMIYHDHKGAIHFITDGERIDYTKINQDEFCLFSEYPFRIDPHYRRMITDDLLVEIWNNTYLERNELIEHLEKQRDRLRIKYGYLRDKLMIAEKERQYQEAGEEMERDFYFRKRAQDLEDARKVYQLK